MSSPEEGHALPKSADATLAAARAAASRGDFAASAKLLRHLLEYAPEHGEACFGLALMCQKMGLVDEAERWYVRTVELRPADAAAMYNLGVVRQAQNRPAEAALAYERAVDLAPGLHQAHCNLGNLHLADGELRQALASYRQALAVQPKAIEARHGMGLALQRLGQFDEAAQAFRQVLSIAPDYLVTLFSIGTLCQETGDLPAAVAWYQRVIQARPDHVDACFNLAKVYQDQGRFDEAERHYRQAIGLCRRADTPGIRTTRLDESYYNLGFILKQQGRQRDWLENFKAFEAASRGSILLALYGAAACRSLGDADGEARHLRHLMAYRYTAQDVPQLRAALGLVLYFDLPQKDVLSLYRQFDDLMTRQVEKWPPLALPARVSGSRIRVGYLSPDFHRHVMGYMMSEIIPRHDVGAFDVYCYSLRRKDDDVTDVLRRHCVKFSAIDGMSPRAAAELIARDELDILVDLATHTKGSEPEILAHKPARVQITHIASAGAVGLSAIDFKLTDGYADTAENQQYLIETLLPMSGCVYPYYHLKPAERHDYQRGKLGISPDTVVIGAFVSLIKLSPRCMAVWRNVLLRFPNARLAFSPIGEQEREGYLRVARAAGIGEDRVLFIPSGSSDAERLARYEMIDMVLDTFPYGGVNGVLEPLSMGVPFVALCGQWHGERSAYSILMNLGVEATIAHSEDEFVAIAVRLVEDAAFREQVLATIRRGLADSPLVDMAAHVRHLEAAYRRALEIKGVL